MVQESELKEKYHRLLQEKRKVDEYLEQLENKLDTVSQEKDSLGRRCKYLDADIAKIRSEKYR